MTLRYIATLYRWPAPEYSTQEDVVLDYAFSPAPFLLPEGYTLPWVQPELGEELDPRLLASEVELGICLWWRARQAAVCLPKLRELQKLLTDLQADGSGMDADSLHEKLSGPCLAARAAVKALHMSTVAQAEFSEVSARQYLAQAEFLVKDAEQKEKDAASKSTQQKQKQKAGSGAAGASKSKGGATAAVTDKLEKTASELRMIASDFENAANSIQDSAAEQKARLNGKYARLSNDLSVAADVRAGCSAIQCVESLYKSVRSIVHVR